jgi:hypothetical protein
MAQKITDYCKIVYCFPNMNSAVTSYETVHENYVKIIIKFRIRLC